MVRALEKEEGKAVLSLAITAKWDLDGSAVVVSMPVNVRRKYEVTALMDDPQQPTLPLGDGGVSSMAIATGGKSVTFTTAELKQASERVSRMGGQP